MRILGPSEKIRTSGLLNPINPFCHNSLLIIIKNVIYLTVCELFSDNLSNDSILFVVKIVVRLSDTSEVCLPPRLCIIIECSVKERPLVCVSPSTTFLYSRSALPVYGCALAYSSAFW